MLFNDVMPLIRTVRPMFWAMKYRRAMFCQTCLLIAVSDRRGCLEYMWGNDHRAMKATEALLLLMVTDFLYERRKFIDWC